VADISVLKEHERHLEYLAHYDTLTHLPNRLLVRDRLHQLVAQTRRSGHLLAVCYLDLDGFKSINDTLGHAAGDQLLKEAAHRLQSTVRAGDTVARLGGDEFAVLLAGLKDELECDAALERILAVVSEPYRLGGASQNGVTVSIGVTLFPSDDSDPDTLLRHADHAMYGAKQTGKNRFKIFNAVYERRIQARHETVHGVEKALSEGQLALHYQPKVNCRKGRVVGAEALIRWQHPRLGLLSPVEFLPLIEGDEVALAVGEWVIREALRQMQEWGQDAISLPVSVNIFARQLQSDDFTCKLAAILGEFPEVIGHQLELEILETVALEDVRDLGSLVRECNSLGVAFTLDDFGTGYFSLDHLRRIPARSLKIDRSFVRDILTDPEDRALVAGILGLGRAFGREVVAEGVDNPDLVRALLAMGCEVMQGYGLAEPMPAPALPQWVSAFRPDPSWGAEVRAPR
jgi:diguanylate cyclase (GGDEF)-like protein